MSKRLLTLDLLKCFSNWMFWFCVWLAGLTLISCLLPWLLPCQPTQANRSSVACSSRQFTHPTLKLLHPTASLPMVDPLLLFTCWWMTYMHVVCGCVMMIIYSLVFITDCVKRPLLSIQFDWQVYSIDLELQIWGWCYQA